MSRNLNLNIQHGLKVSLWGIKDQEILKELCITVYEDDLYYYYKNSRGFLRIKKRSALLKNSRNFTELIKNFPEERYLKKIPHDRVLDHWIFNYFFNTDCLEKYSLKIENLELDLMDIDESHLRYSTYGININKSLKNFLIIDFSKGMEYCAYEILMEYLKYTNSSFDFTFFNESMDSVDLCFLFFGKRKLIFRLDEKGYTSILKIKIKLIEFIELDRNF